MLSNFDWSGPECISDEWTDNFGDDCDWYENNADSCGFFDPADGSGVGAADACCACGGGTPVNGSDAENGDGLNEWEWYYEEEERQITISP